jgi:hypothetical protein
VWNELNHYRCLTKSQRRLLWEALIALASARFAMVFLSFKQIAIWLGTPGVESSFHAPVEQVEIATNVGWAIRSITRRVPWDSRCLGQALAATWMLRRRGLEPTVTFGADTGKMHEFLAHAWLRFGPCLVTGGVGYEKFKAVTSLTRKQS